jgi:ubiquinol-cytochrome c reductase cytochrome c subunit
MPVFGPLTLSDQQASDVAAYVQYLRHPKNRGGLGLGHIGPIAEGFVGWVVGMGLLLLVTRLIGTRG